MLKNGGKYINGYECNYIIYPDGKIINSKRGTDIAQFTLSGNAKYVKLSVNGVSTQHTVHKLVFEHFNNVEIFPIKYKNIGKYYGCDKSGNIWSYYMNRKMEPQINYWGYQVVALYIDNNYKLYRVHRLMGYTFLDMQHRDINHINGNKLDNRLENLECVTSAYNIRHAAQFRTNRSSKYLGVSKVNRKNRILWKCSIQVNNEDMYLGMFNTEIDAAKAYNVASIKYLNKNDQYLNNTE